MEEILVVLRQAVFQLIKEGQWVEMHVKLKGVTNKIGLQNAAQMLLVRVKWLGGVHRKTTSSQSQSKSSVLSTGALLFVNFFLSIWIVDIHQESRNV